MSQQVISEVAKNIKQLEREIALGKALTSLENNPDFKLVFEQFLFTEQPTKLVKQLATPLSETRKEHLQKSITGLGVLMNMLDDIKDKAEQASINVDEAYRLDSQLNSEGY